MKFALYSDYGLGLPTYGGGGEVYAVRLASGLVNDGHSVSFFSNKINDVSANIVDVFRFYDVDEFIIEQIDFQYAPSIDAYYKTRLNNEKSTYCYLKKRLKNYDYFINCSESTMHGFNKTLKLPSYKIVHFPWGLFSQNKFLSWHIKGFYKLTYDSKLHNSYELFLPNSNFTKGWVKKIWGGVTNIKTLYPPIKCNQISVEELANKKNHILYTGRVIKEKMCLEFAECFQKIFRKFPDWTFVIVGNYNPKDSDYVEEVESALQGTNYQIHFDAPQDKLIQYYKDSKIFWSGKGYGTDNPLNMEHFGMTTVEAMANGCVPVVINKAGQAEIVNDNFGYRWDTLEQLIYFTEDLILNEQRLTEFSKNAVTESDKYLMNSFMNNFYNCIGLNK